MWIDTLREYGSRLIGRYRGPRFEADMDEELQFHIQMQTDQYVRSGLSPQEARRRALLEFGGVEQTREECRDAVGIQLMNDFVNDLRYALRTLLRSPGFTIVAVLTLALGIGANTAVFSVVHTLLLQPLPFEEPEQLVMIWEKNAESGFEEDLVAWTDFFDWKDKCQTVETFGFVVNNMSFSRNFLLRSGEDVERIRGRHASSGLFKVFGVQPMLGQTLQETDDVPGTARRAVLSHAMWKQAFGSDPQVIGRSMDVGRGEPFEIIGVMPASFRFPQDADVWLSLSGWFTEKSYQQRMRQRSFHHLWVVARLKDGISVSEASADLNLIQKQIADDPANRGMTRLASGVVVTPMLDQVNGQETRPALFMLLGAVGFVLLIACVNVANLLLARALSRRREIAIRVALGASRMRVIRQLLTESLLLSLMGAAAGILLALLGIQLLELIRTDATHLGVKSLRFDRFNEVGINQSVLWFTLSVSVATGLLFGLIPAIQTSKLDVNEALKEDSRSGTPGRATRYLRNGLLIAEVGLTLVLMAGAGAAIRGFAKMLAVDVGMEPQNVLRAELDLDMAAKVYGIQPDAAYDEVISRVTSLPGVASVSGFGEAPLIKSGWNDTFKILGSDHESLTTAQLPATDVRNAGPRAFETLGVALLEGREFTSADDNTSPSVAIINASFKERFFPNESPLGKTVQMRGWKGHEKTIVGVVGTVRNYTDDSIDQPEIYMPFKQTFVAGAEVGPAIVIRTRTRPEETIDAIRHAVDGPDPRQQVLVRFTSMESVLAMSASTERFQTVLLGCFAGVGLMLSVIGVYGVMAYSTSQRIREIGIRLALGASPTQILRAIVGQCSVLCLVGIVFGLVASLMLGKLLSSVFFGFEMLDPVVLLGVSLLLLFVGVAAGLVPGWNAMRIDPLQALRHE